MVLNQAILAIILSSILNMYQVFNVFEQGSNSIVGLIPDGRPLTCEVVFAPFICDRVYSIILNIGERIAPILEPPYSYPLIRFCEVILLKNNPLEGIFPCEMEFINGENGKKIKIENVKLYRESKDGEWTISPSFKRTIGEQLS